MSHGSFFIRFRYGGDLAIAHHVVFPSESHALRGLNGESKYKQVSRDFQSNIHNQSSTPITQKFANHRLCICTRCFMHTDTLGCP